MSLIATARSISCTLRQKVVIDGEHRLITDEPQRVDGQRERLERVANAYRLSRSIETGTELVETIERREAVTQREPAEIGGAF
jgi:hypothetical protein